MAEDGKKPNAGPGNPSDSDNKSRDESSSGDPVAADGSQNNLIFLLHEIRDGIRKFEKYIPKADTVDWIKDITAFETQEKLFKANPAARANMIKQLATVLGENASDITSRTMDRYLSNGVMSQFNFTGSDGKKNFSATEIYSVLKEAIIRASRASVNEVEAAMKEHLRRASDRVIVTQIKDMDDFKRQEDIFKTNPTARADMIQKLANCEETLKHITGRIMSRFLSNGVMQEFSFKGRTRDNFSGTEIFSVLIEAIMMASGASKDEVECAMEKYFNNAQKRKDP